MNGRKKNMDKNSTYHKDHSIGWIRLLIMHFQLFEYNEYGATIVYTIAV